MVLQSGVTGVNGSYFEYTGWVPFAAPYCVGVALLPAEGEPSPGSFNEPHTSIQSSASAPSSVVRLDYYNQPDCSDPGGPARSTLLQVRVPRSHYNSN